MSKNKSVRKNTVIKPAPEVKEQAVKAEATNSKAQTKKPAAEVQNAEISKIITSGTNRSALDSNHQVDMLGLMAKYFHDTPNAAERYKVSQQFVDEMDRITAIGVVTVLANEVMTQSTPFAVTMRPAVLNNLIEAASELGITIDAKLLPAPEEKAETVVVPSAAISVSKETKEQLKKENKILDQGEPNMDVTKFENEDDLKKSLLFLLSHRQSPFEYIQKAISLYQAYLNYQASKSENKEEELAKVAKISRSQLFSMITDLVEEAPIVVSGIGNFLYTVTAGTKSPVSAFCRLRNAALSKIDGSAIVEDSFVVDIVKSLIAWSAKIKAKNNAKSIEAVNKNLEVLNKDPEKNKAAIEDQNAQLEKLNGNIEYFNKVVDYAMNPESTTLDEFLAKRAEGDTSAVKMFRTIIDTYYPGVDLQAVPQEVLFNNIKQRAGIITNLFRDPNSQLMQYSESNIVAIDEFLKGAEEAAEETTEVETTSTEETVEKTEKESKN